MTPLHRVDDNFREQRLQDGCCPNCGTRLYKVTDTSGGRMSKLFKRRNSNDANSGKLTPLTVPGVVERGQCIQCRGGVGAGEDLANSANYGGAAKVAIAVPTATVKAVPVLLSSSTAARESNEDEGKFPPQSKLDAPGSGQQKISYESSNMSLKQPPESLLESGPHAFVSNPNKVPVSKISQPSWSESDGSESDDSSDDDSIALEDIPLLDLSLCPVEYDHASSNLVNNLKRWGKKADAMDDRKPAAKTVLTNVESVRESAAIDMAFLESSSNKNRPGDGGANKLECPPDMSPEVFYQLPPEMQKEVMEQQQRSDNGSSCNSSNSQTKKDAGRGHEVDDTTTPTADIDPETLASLPDDIRKEVLEQARREQQQSKKNAAANDPSFPTVPRRAMAADAPRRRAFARKTSQLTKSTTAYLNDCDIDEDVFREFPQEVKNDILEQRRLDKQVPESENATKKLNSVHEDTDLDHSEFDPETLASLPEDVRKEVLDEERRQREKRHQSEKKKKTPSVVGAHSVNVPAGYDPETFEALPKDVQQDLIDDARQAQQQGLRCSAEGYDYESIVDARVVQAQPPGGASAACTYTGEYNIMGKRHGDGELKWANGDAYVGTFKMGYIEGRGTINFHDGTEYAGQWKGNRFHGMGTRRFKNGNVYTGNYAEGKRRGQGRCYFANGDLYVGDWKADTIHGFGRYYYNNGHSFEGMFRNGKRNGRGKYQLTDGRVEIYRYVNDSRAGDGVCWSKSRKKAWRMNHGKITKRVSIEEAAAIAKRCGPVLEES